MMLNWLRSHLAGTSVPTFAPDTFIVWEPCTYSHAEVLPGYVKYLLDLGFRVAVFVTPRRYEEGLFSRFSDERMVTYRLSQRAIRRAFRRHGIGQARGIMVTTARKISGRPDYISEQRLFAQRGPQQRLLLVEHDVKPPADHGALTPEIITLREPHLGFAATTVVNPHYFGTVQITPKSIGMTRFITIGTMRSKRRNTRVLIDAVNALHKLNITAFKITVIGRGELRAVPRHLRAYFEIKGRVDFTTLYAELEQADFFLPLLDPDNAAHERYITTATSGSFQLIYGTGKPCLIAEKFAAPNGFDATNSIIYSDNSALLQAMQSAISMPQERYAEMQQQLLGYSAGLYQRSLENLRRLIA